MKTLLYLFFVIVLLVACDDDEYSPSNLVIATTQVYEGEAPVTWMELDLSSVVGKNNTQVTLRLTNYSSASGVAARFRQKGDTNDYIYEYEADTQNGTNIGYNGVGQVTTFTDENGLIEWKANSSVEVKLEVIAYMK